MEKTLDSMLSVDLVRSALRSEDRPAGWTNTLLHSAFDRYVKFLKLIRKYPDREIAPARDIDYMWHLHMLHPRAYQADCERFFGEVLDHDGGFGASADEEADLKRIFEGTSNLWRAEYGESYVDDDGRTRMVKCTRNCVSRCTRACKTK